MTAWNNPKNKKLLAAILSSLLMLSGCDWVAGNFKKQPEDYDTLSPAALKLIAAAYQDIDKSRLADYHTHIFGISPETTGTFVNAKWQNPMYLIKYIFKFRMYMSAADIDDIEDADNQMFDRLDRLVTNINHNGKFGIMAFDYFHNEQGDRDPELTTFHVPNDYMKQRVDSRRDRYFYIASIHPYRDDAVQELRLAGEMGVHYIKWLPNAMGINPSHKDGRIRKKLLEYYKVMQQYGMVLISHTGDEKATEAENFQHLGNPIYLDLPLSSGVKVVMAHVASLGECRKEDMAVSISTRSGKSIACKEDKAYIDVAFDMLRHHDYRENLFGEISALTQFNRMDKLKQVLEADDLYPRMINGSDYPLPAVNFVIQTKALMMDNYITVDEREALNEIYHVNPLLFDFVLKRTIKHPETQQKFAASMFMQHPDLPSP